MNDTVGCFCKWCNIRLHFIYFSSQSAKREFFVYLNHRHKK
uniref:Uncharacterized protein n=1 Tax=Anguilla anguilla TaxID=7936 RepID=A0A0E9VVH5_ANGAN